MDFTREPIIETVITPKEGCKLVVRSSKNSGQEEYFVDAVEVVSFGNSFYFRSLERPKSFLVPSSDYEILEVREARMVLKNVGLERSIKIGGGREPHARPQAKEPAPERAEVEVPALEEVAAAEGATALAEPRPEGRLEKKRDRRRHYRRRRGRDETAKEGGEPGAEPVEDGDAKIELPAPRGKVEEGGEGATAEPVQSTSQIMSSILPPPPTLISETIARYKDNAMFRGAFFMKEEEGKVEIHETPAEQEQEKGSSGESQENEDDEIFRKDLFSEEEDEEDLPFPELSKDAFDEPGGTATDSENRIPNGNSKEF